MTDRVSFFRSLAVLLVIALLAWMGLFLFTYYVYPESAMSFFVFFLLLFIALICTFSPLAYLIDRRFLFSRRQRNTLQQAMRQGGLLSMVIVFNLILRVLDSWSLLIGFVVLCAAIVVEILSLARKG